MVRQVTVATSVFAEATAMIGDKLDKDNAASALASSMLSGIMATLTFTVIGVYIIL